jgi:hypothetical protein
MLEHWPQGLKIGFPKWMVSFFKPWGQIHSHKVQHLLVTSGTFFSIPALTPSVKALGADFNFCTNRIA